jgi:hypothetical protein
MTRAALGIFLLGRSFSRLGSPLEEFRLVSFGDDQLIGAGLSGVGFRHARLSPEKHTQPPLDLLALLLGASASATARISAHRRRCGVFCQPAST